jgi:Tfp pilus assembly protein PilO
MNRNKSHIDLSNRTSLTAVAFCLITVIIVFFLLWPSFQKLQEVQAEITRKEVEIEGKKEYLSNLDKTKSELEERGEEISRIESALPSGSFLPSLFNYLQKTSSESGLILGGISSGSPSSLEKSPTVQETTISIDLIGSYSALNNFLVSLEKSARLIRIESIDFSSGEGGRLFTFKLKMKVYSYNQ